MVRIQMDPKKHHDFGYKTSLMLIYSIDINKLSGVSLGSKKGFQNLWSLWIYITVVYGVYTRTFLCEVHIGHLEIFGNLNTFNLTYKQSQGLFCLKPIHTLSLKLTARTWNTGVGRWIPFAMLVLGSVPHPSFKSTAQIAEPKPTQQPWTG